MGPTIYFLFSIFLAFFGASIGSFLGVLIDRLPKEKSITGRSRCDFCHHHLAWNDLIPIISFFSLKGRCRYCRKKLSFFYPLIEILTAVLFVSIIAIPGLIISPFNLSMFAWLGIVSSLIVIFFADLKYQIIPDSIQLSLLVFAHLLKITQGITFATLLPCYLAALIVALPILVLYLVTRGRGMGFGDAKLAFTMGFLLGVKGGLLAVYFGFILGAVVGLILILLKKKGIKSKIAFGPFLVVGTLIIIYWQKEIFNFVNKIYGI